MYGLDIREILTFDEVGEYLNRLGEISDLYSEQGRDKLFRYLSVSIRNMEIHALAFYSGPVHCCAKQDVSTLTGQTNEGNSYFALTLPVANNIISNGQEKTLLNGIVYFDASLFDLPREKIPSQFYFIKPEESNTYLNFYDLCYSIHELDKVFRKGINLFQSLEQELAETKVQIVNLQNALRIEKEKKLEISSDNATGLDRFNAERSQLINTGKAIAQYLWSMDATESIKTGDMVQQIKQVLLNVNASLLPDDKAIRSWLTDIAPPYAKKAGKPPKNAPTEIPLMMRR